LKPVDSHILEKSHQKFCDVVLRLHQFCHLNDHDLTDAIEIEETLFCVDAALLKTRDDLKLLGRYKSWYSGISKEILSKDEKEKIRKWAGALPLDFHPNGCKIRYQSGLIEEVLAERDSFHENLLKQERIGWLSEAEVAIHWKVTELNQTSLLSYIKASLDRAFQEHRDLAEIFCNAWDVFERASPIEIRDRKVRIRGVFDVDLPLLITAFRCIFADGLELLLNERQNSLKPFEKEEKPLSLDGIPHFDALVSPRTKRVFAGVLNDEDLEQLRLNFYDLACERFQSEMRFALHCTEALPQNKELQKLSHELQKIEGMEKDLGQEIRLKLYYEVGREPLLQIQKRLGELLGEH
jgi:hypothetical protein